MFITYEDLKKIEEQCVEDIRKSQAKLEVVKELLILAKSKEEEAVKSECVDCREEPCVCENTQVIESIV